MHAKVIAVALAAVLAVPSAVIAAELNDGEWEITTTTQMSGMPDMPPGMGTQKHTVRHCITKAEGRDPTAMARPPGHHESDCKPIRQSINGNKVSMEIDCGENGRIVTEMTSQSDSYAGTTEMIPGTSEMPRIKTTFSGRRLGACPAR